MRISRFSLDARGTPTVTTVDDDDLDQLAVLRMLAGDSEEGEPVPDDEAREP
jgi:hypothetical protein